MKKIASGLVGFSFACLLSIGALANHNDLKENVNINSKIYVNGVKVKPGRYTVRYNTESGDMTMSRDGKVVVTAKATVTTSSDEFENDALLTRETTNGTELTGIRLGGQNAEITISQMTAQAESVSFIPPYEPCSVSEDGYVIAYGMCDETKSENSVTVSDQAGFDSNGFEETELNEYDNENPYEYMLDM
jgi:hypothetical protein